MVPGLARTALICACCCARGQLVFEHAAACGLACAQRCAADISKVTSVRTHGQRCRIDIAAVSPVATARLQSHLYSHPERWSGAHSHTAPATRHIRWLSLHSCVGLWSIHDMRIADVSQQRHDQEWQRRSSGGDSAASKSRLRLSAFGAGKLDVPESGTSVGMLQQPCQSVLNKEQNVTLQSAPCCRCRAQ